MPPVRVVLVAGGRWHDFDYARLELLNALAQHDEARTSVGSDYRALDALPQAAALITYTCDLRPSAAEVAVLRAWVTGGGRWLALHGTASAIDAPLDGRGGDFSTPRVIDELVDLAGGQFLAHPPIGSYRVEVTAPDHPLVTGLTAFETVDELYIGEMRAGVEVLLHTTFGGDCPRFAEGRALAVAQRPVLWQQPTGAGMVTYLTLGHCRGRWDVADRGVPDTGRLDRVAWKAPGFRSILERTIGWAVHGGDGQSCTCLKGVHSK